jgi:peroxiredoxin
MRAKVSLLLLLLTIMFFLGVNPAFGQKKASAFTLVDLDGNTFSLSSCPAKIVLVDFFATYCSPCINAIPTLRSIYDEYSRDQLEIISISPEGESTLRIFAQQHNMTWIIAQDTAGVSDDYSVTYIPRTFLVNADGYIRYDHTGWSGEVDALELHSKISSLLSGTGNGGNGDSNNNSNTGQTGPPYTLIAIIVGAVIVFLVVGIVVAGQLLGWSEPSKKRGSRKRRR